MSIEELDRLGIEYSRTEEWVGPPPRRREEGPWVNYITLPLTSDDWCQLCRDDGDFYLGGCCGQMSHFQDSLNKFFRFGNIHTGEFLEVIEAAKTHDGFKRFRDDTDPIPDNWRKSFNPLEKLSVAYHAVKDVAVPTSIDMIGIGKGIDLDNLEDCFKALEKSINIVYWRNLVSIWEKDPSHQIRMNSQMELARVYVPLKKVYEKLAESPPHPILGYAIIDEEGNITKNGRGLVLVESKEEAENLMEFWYRDANQNRKESLAKLRIRKCEVSIQHGVRFL